MINKECIIYDDKICDMCGDCNFCDLNPDKICDSCGQCVDDYDYSGVEIDKLILDDQTEGEYIEACHDEDCDCCDGEHHHHHH